jgi:predicted RNase H-like HicB family nuclease
MDLQVDITQDEHGWFVAEVPELPGCISQGRSEREALDNAKEAVEAWFLAERQNSVAE